MPAQRIVLRVTIWGKIVGGVAGYAIGGPIGALIGVIAGHLYDRYRALDWWARLDPRRTPGRERPRRRRSEASHGARDAIFSDPAETRKIAFATAVVVLGAKLSKVDGVVTHDEIRAFKRVFQIDDDEVGDVARIYNQAKTSPRGFEPYARQVATLFSHDTLLLEELLAGLFEIARSDGALNPAELDYLRRVAGFFGFSAADFERIRARFSGTERTLDGSDDAYAVLGLKRAANDDEIKSTYRRLVREHHPDSLVARGLPPELIEQANHTLASINAAYDRIAKERSLR